MLAVPSSGCSSLSQLPPAGRPGSTLNIRRPCPASPRPALPAEGRRPIPRNKATLNVKQDFGAKGDGKTDDARALKVRGWGLGLGFARYKNTGGYAAVAAEIEARERVFCRRLWIAGDVGEVVNPDGVANQYEGGAIHGTSVALLERVAFDRRRVTSDSWETYPILRFSDVPKVAVELIDRPELPFLGAGEASMAPTIAAIGAAITDALGIRPRALPFTPEQLASAT